MGYQAVSRIGLRILLNHKPLTIGHCSTRRGDGAPMAAHGALSPLFND